MQLKPVGIGSVSGIWVTKAAAPKAFIGQRITITDRSFALLRRLTREVLPIPFLKTLDFGSERPLSGSIHTFSG